MNKPLLYILTILLLLPILSSLAFAGEREHPFKPGGGGRRGNQNSEPVSSVSVGQPAYGGNGCPQGTMRVAFAPDYQSFSILYDGFVAETTSARKDVMTCDILLPMQLPPGMQMEITRVDYRGFVALPAKSKATLHSVFNFRGGGGDGGRINMRYRFEGPVTDNYELSTLEIANPNKSSEVSSCGGAIRLRVYNQLRLLSKKGEAASVTIDSIDGANNAVYYVNWRSCT